MYSVPKVRCKVVREENGMMVTLNSPDGLYEAVSEYLADCDVEHMIVVNLDTKLNAISFREISVGALNFCHVYIPSVFKSAILENASCIMLAHNHPSGDTTPSGEDYSLTEKVIKAGKLMDIPLMEHLIVGDDYYSFRENDAEMFKGVIA